MYLWHPFIIFALSPVYRAIYAMPMSSWLRLGFSIAITIPIVTIIAYCSYKWIELPGQSLGKAFLKRMSREKPTIQVPAK
jgi:peptidoglycan/LPS O-acetylase OafA/YrhL